MTTSTCRWCNADWMDGRCHGHRADPWTGATVPAAAVGSTVAIRDILYGHYGRMGLDLTAVYHTPDQQAHTPHEHRSAKTISLDTGPSRREYNCVDRLHYLATVAAVDPDGTIYLADVVGSDVPQSLLPSKQNRTPW